MSTMRSRGTFTIVTSPASTLALTMTRTSGRSPPDSVSTPRSRMLRTPSTLTGRSPQASVSISSVWMSRADA
ncbi:hypothetical protein BJF83_15850 [Nocardiopsis sp. CNR-923]|nr:hypothetical protein BJF83_15850 [Nocardiopsis sp. CNR-923]